MSIFCTKGGSLMLHAMRVIMPVKRVRADRLYGNESKSVIFPIRNSFNTLDNAADIKKIADLCRYVTQVEGARYSKNPNAYSVEVNIIYNKLGNTVSFEDVSEKKKAPPIFFETFIKNNWLKGAVKMATDELRGRNSNFKFRLTFFYKDNCGVTKHRDSHLDTAVFAMGVYDKETHKLLDTSGVDLMIGAYEGSTRLPQNPPGENMAIFSSQCLHYTNDEVDRSVTPLRPYYRLQVAMHILQED
jgi:hypothetical protein